MMEIEHGICAGHKHDKLGLGLSSSNGLSVWLGIVDIDLACWRLSAFQSTHWWTMGLIIDCQL